MSMAPQTATASAAVAGTADPAAGDERRSAAGRGDEEPGEQPEGHVEEDVVRAVGGPIAWPREVAGGLWELPLQQVRVATSGWRTLSIDYNLGIAQTRGKAPPAEVLPALRQQALDTWRNLYRAAFEGNRAPISIANHFNDFNGGIYRDALTAFVTETCARPETRCVSYRELADWLDAQTPETIRRLQALPAAVMDW
jgi:hypothetical protein